MKIKLCGMMRECDIDFANAAEPDYVGFIFADTRRKITMEQAKNFKRKLNKNIKAVGVFVDKDIKFIQELVDKNIIDMIQLHGHEDNEYIKKIDRSIPIIKAVRVPNNLENEEDIDNAKRMILEAQRLRTDYLLLDVNIQNTLGGTGKCFDWSMIPNLEKEYFLAGGINFENIDEAKKSNAFALDLSSAIETDGMKDKNKMIEIVRRTRQ